MYNFKAFNLNLYQVAYIVSILSIIVNNMYIIKYEVNIFIKKNRGNINYRI